MLQPVCWPPQLDIVLNQNAVVQECDPRRLEQPATSVETRTPENDVVALPLAGRTADIDQWRILAVNGSSLPVGIGLVFIGVEYLNLILSHQENAAIATPLALAHGRHGRRPFHMQLNIAESA